MIRYNPNWNDGIARLLPHDPMVADKIYNELLKRWPQINRQTKLSFTNGHQIYMADLAYLPPVSMPTSKKRVAISGWGRLTAFNSWFTLKQLDDPQARAKYHAGLIYAVLHVPMYMIWRIAGRLFKQDVWISWGTEWQYEYDVPAAAPMPLRRTINLEQMGVQWYEFREVRRFYLICGYDPTTDTFFVKK